MTTQTINGFTCNAAGEPREFGLYNPNLEHENCGIGFIVNLNAKPEHDLVRKVITILSNLEHRCAIGADGKTSDGAGYCTVTPYTVTPYQAAEPVDVNSLENRVKRLEEILNGKPDDAGTEPKRRAKTE